MNLGIADTIAKVVAAKTFQITEKIRALAREKPVRKRSDDIRHKQGTGHEK